MKKILIFLIFVSTTNILLANDGVFYAKGNQLIPITETDISVKKEILHLRKISDKRIEISVYYEFYNPKEDKEITVGFEAFSPSGDVDGAPVNGMHPYMNDFTVNMNGKNLPFQVAYVNDSLYNQNGKINGIDLNKFDGNTSGNEVDFFYVYHFNSKFKKGLNIIKHTYTYNLSGSIGYHYDFEYVLTAANRWKNKQIDDFTLLLDMGEFETFSINKTFFKNADEWVINGIGKTEDISGYKNSFIETDALKFHLQKGTLIFSKKDFRPTGELFVYAQNYIGIKNFSYIPFSCFQEENIEQPKNDFQRKILQNLPFARRGYVFKNEMLKKYFENLDWYIPNPDYIPEPKRLSEREKKWLQKWK